MDVDSTFIEEEVIELLAEHAGRRAEVAAVTERAMRGELDFADSLRERVAVLAGLEESVLDSVRESITLTRGVEALVRSAQEAGWVVGLVSGGFTAIISPVAAGLGIDEVYANTLEIADGRLTGRVTGEIVDRAGKAARLRALCRAYGAPETMTAAIGDGANDIDMVETAAVGVAFCAKPALREAADVVLDDRDLARAWELIGERLPRS